MVDAVKDLNFEEFVSVRERERTEGVSTSQPATVKVGKKKKAAFGLGQFLELNETQLFCVFLLFLDTVAAYGELLIDQELNTSEIEESYLFMVRLAHKGVATFRTFAMVYFVAELASVITVFRFGIVGHLGYMLDVVIIVCQIHYGGYTSSGSLIDSIRFGGNGGDDASGNAETLEIGNFLGMLNYLRLWRMYRLFYTLVNREREAHDETRKGLEILTKDLGKVKTNAAVAEEELDKEKNARAAVEEMLQNYKEEVDTLNEALKIAARDIAEVAEADDDLLSDDEDAFDDALSKASSANVSVKKEVLYDQARKSNIPPQRPTFVVGGDGTFKKL
jgi:hypothetical protein